METLESGHCIELLAQPITMFGFNCVSLGESSI